MCPYRHEAQSLVKEGGGHYTSKQIKIYTSTLRSGLRKEETRSCNSLRQVEKLGWSGRAFLIFKVQYGDEMELECKE